MEIEHVKQQMVFLDPTVDNQLKHFVWVDYMVFGGMLLISTLIGIYFAFKDTIFSNAGEFLIANGKLGVLPVALSMLASFLSSITLIGQSAEAFLFGPQLWLFGVSCFAIVPIVGYVFVPFFQEKNYISAYEFFGERYSRKLQLVASVLFTFQMVLYLALVLYAPAMAVNHVTGVNTFLIVSIMYLVCIFYTTIGGMRAVVWTDSFQIVVLYGAMFAVLIKGTVDIGGFSVVWKINEMYNRTALFNWDTDPTVRYSLWSSFIGSGFLHIIFYGGNQLQIQRYLTVKTASQARRMLWINTVGWTIIVFLTVYAGLLIFASYAHCDPFKSNKITTADELFPLYVMETLYEYPGFPGLFLAGVFSAGLSTVSAGINSLAALWINEVRGTLIRDENWEKRGGISAKILAFGFGMFSFLAAFVVPFLGGLTPVAIALSGIFTGSLFGVFCLGMFIPSSNNNGAMTGLLSSVGVLTWMATGNIIFSRSPKEFYLKLNIPMDGCANNYTVALNSPFTSGYEQLPTKSVFYLYNISYLWYPMLASVMTVVVGVVVSYITSGHETTNNHVGSTVKGNGRLGVPLDEGDEMAVRPFLHGNSHK